MQIEVGDRQASVIHALRIIAHTQLLDPEFVEHCMKVAADNPCRPTFGALLEQDETEYVSMLGHLKGCRSALEIGSRYGKSLLGIAMQLEPKSRVVAVDLSCIDPTGAAPDPKPILNDSLQAIANMGHDAKLFRANSRDPDVVEAVRKLGPYDFVFIDGDHSYEGVKADWENYGPMATRMVAFHDIVNNIGCFTVWKGIKAAGYRTVEYTSSVWLGIGIAFKNNNGGVSA